LSFAFAFARLSARFSLRDLAAFLDMCCRGDLSAMVCSLVGSLVSSAGSTVRLLCVDDAWAQL
jgi:hypothetical protein